MGMFDDITDVPVLNCRRCGHPLSGWQSKDGECALDKIPYWEVRNFYVMCHNKIKGKECCEWHEYQLREPNHPRPISDYDLLPARSGFTDDRGAAK